MRQYQYQQVSQFYEITRTAELSEWCVDHARLVPRAPIPQRDYSNCPVISGFEATNIDQWQTVEWRSGERKPVYRAQSAQLVQPIVPDPSLPNEWLAQEPHRLLPRPSRRDAGAWTPPFIEYPEPTPIGEWQPHEPRPTFSIRTLARLVQQQRERSIFLPQFIAGYPPGRNWIPRGWNPRGWDRPHAAATPIGQWQPLQGRHVPRAWTRPNREQLVFIQLVPEEGTTVDQWNPYGPTQFRSRRPQRNYTAFTPSLITDPTSIDQWQPIEGDQIRHRRPNRAEIVLVQLVELPEPELPEWFPYEPRRIRPIRPQRDYSVLVTFVDVQPSTIDQWQGFDPVQFRPRRPQRDDSAYTIISGFEATPLTEWEPRIARVVPKRIVRRSEQIQLVEFIETPPTSVREWLGNDPRRLRIRLPNRNYIVSAVEPVPDIIKIIHNVMDVLPVITSEFQVSDQIIEIEIIG